MWFSDYLNPPGVREADANWSSAGGGFIKRSGYFQIKRQGNTWTIIGYRDQQRLNEWLDVSQQITRGGKTSTSCSTAIAYDDVTTPIRFCLTVGY